jgi:hypothetical protein
VLIQIVDLLLVLFKFLHCATQTLHLVLHHWHLLHLLLTLFFLVVELLLKLSHHCLLLLDRLLQLLNLKFLIEYDLVMALSLVFLFLKLLVSSSIIPNQALYSNVNL